MTTYILVRALSPMDVKHIKLHYLPIECEPSSLSPDSMSLSLKKKFLLAIWVASLGVVSSVCAGPIEAVGTSCQMRGAIDTPAKVTSRDTDFHLEGWAADPAGVARVDIRAGGKLLGSFKTTVMRTDVSSAMPQCRFPDVSGFSAEFAIGVMPPQSTRLEAIAITNDNRSFTVGGIPVDLSSPRGTLDLSSPIEADGENLIVGWAVASQGPVKVTILAQDIEILTLAASMPREDVAKALPAWPQAAKSGFEGLLPFHKLPRGRYHLRVLFSDGKGNSSEIAGPEVINDLPFGKVLAQQDKLLAPDSIALRAWLADEDGIKSARLETQAGVPLGDMKIVGSNQSLAELDPARFNPNQPNEAPLKQGDVYSLSLPRDALPSGLQRLLVRVEDKAGKIALLPGLLVLDANPGQGAGCAGDKLRVFYPGGAANFRHEFRQLQELRALAQGGCVEIGLRGRLEYLRTTKGRTADYEFDPDFPEHLRNRNGQEMTGESLGELLRTALHFNAPMMITLDGGVWADAKFAAADVDIVDMLEQDEGAVQWNHLGKSEPDDALKDLAGATANPELARMMSLNRYNQKFLDYKKRNLQSAIRAIVAFSRAHPEHYVAINLDPDQYINPWFYLTQWYDYNPDTLRQYREWLFHLGPYADGAELAFSRREPALTLADVNRLAKQSWQEASAVEPPRAAIDYSDPWQQLWTQFKRHLVARHYDDLANWAVEAGFPSSHIYTSQTFIQADVAVRITDRADGWSDQAGVSIEGAKPRQGHLGAILYGKSSRNEGKPRSGTSLIDNIRRIDPEWGVVEFHPATIAFPKRMPGHADSYATMQALINGGTRFLSPIWGSHAGDSVVHPSSVKSYDVMEGSDFEYQFVWWLRAMQAWPVGSLYYPFGNDGTHSSDGWTAAAGARLSTRPGSLSLTGKTPLGLLSPKLEMRALKPKTELLVSGNWQAGTTLRAKFTLDNGGMLSCILQAATKEQARCILPAKPGRQVSQVKLEWKRMEPGPIEVNVTEVVLTFADNR